jgi:hypothetical protein
MIISLSSSLCDDRNLFKTSFSNCFLTFSTRSWRRSFLRFVLSSIIFETFMRSLNKFFLLMIFAFMLIMLLFICFSAAILTEVFMIFCFMCSLESITLMMREWRLFAKFWDSFIAVQKKTLSEFWFIEFFIVFMIKERIIEFDRVMIDAMSSSSKNSWNDDSSSEIILLFAAIMSLNTLMICFLMMLFVMTFM